MNIEVNLQDDITTVSLSGRFDAQSAGDVDAKLIEVLGGGVQKLIIEMLEVEYVSSAGLRVLLSTAKKLSAAGGQLALCGLKPYVFEVFEVAGFTTIFQIFPDADEARASF